jgi:hypothetical protein
VRKRGEGLKFGFWVKLVLLALLLLVLIPRWSESFFGTFCLIPKLPNLNLSAYPLPFYKYVSDGYEYRQPMP